MKRDAVGRRWNLGVEVPGDSWIVLHLHTPDVTGWAARAARDRLSPDAPAADLAALTDNLIWYFAAARERRALLAGVFTPSPSGAVSAFLHVIPIACPPEQRNVPALVREIRRSREPRLPVPEADSVTLPVGPACRMHEISAGPGADGEVGIMEYVSHFVFPATVPNGIIEVTLSWASSGISEVYQDAADRIARSLTVGLSRAG